MTAYADGSTPRDDGLNLKYYLRLLWERAWLIFLVSLGCGLAAFVVSKLARPIYQATAMAMVEVPSNRVVDSSALTAAEQLTRTYAEMMTSSTVLTETRRALDLAMPVEMLEEMIAVDAKENTQLMEVRVEASDPKLASDIANTLVDAFALEVDLIHSRRFAESVSSLEMQLADVEEKIQAAAMALDDTHTAAERVQLEGVLSEYGGVRLTLLRSLEEMRLGETQAAPTIARVEAADVPDEPVRPRVNLNTILAALVGMLLTTAVVLTVEELDERLTSPEDITQRLGLHILGVIDHADLAGAGDLVSAQHPRSLAAEECRTLRTNLQFSQAYCPLKSILVSSPEPGEGKTFLAVNLALVYAASGVETCLVDGDLRSPALHQRFRICNCSGLTNLLARKEKHKAEAAWCQLVGDHLQVVPSGAIPPNPSEVLAAKQVKKALKKLGERADILIFDSPPVLAFADALILASLVEGVLVVLSAGETKRSQAEAMLAQLRRANANILGAVVTFPSQKSKNLTRRFGYFSKLKYARHYQSA